MKKVIVLLAIMVIGSGFSGCVTERGSYRVLTTGVGALAGQLIGRDTKSTLIGAGTGLAVGLLTEENVISNQQSQVIYAQPKARRKVPYNPPPRLLSPTGNAARWARSPRDRAYYRAKDQVYRQEYRRWEREERRIGRAEGELEALQNVRRNRRGFFTKY